MNWRSLACLSYFSLLIWILVWKAWLDPPYPAALLLTVLLMPLVLVLRGILYARPYAHAWLTLLTPFYFALGVSDAYAGVRLYGLGVMLLSLGLFAGSIGFIRSYRRKAGFTDKSLQ
jgi:uncharacterized membrane protein